MTLRWERKEGEYTWCEDWKTPGWEHSFDKELRVSRWHNNEGHPAVITLEPDAIPYDWIEAYGMFLVSDRLRQLFDEFKVSAEYLPVTVMQHGNDIEKPQYFC